MLRDFRTDNYGGRVNLVEVDKIDVKAQKDTNSEIATAGSIGGETQEIIKKCNTMKVVDVVKIVTAVYVLKNLSIRARIGSMGQLIIDVGDKCIQIWITNEKWRDGNAAPGSGSDDGLWELVDYIDTTYFKIPANKIFK